MRSDVLRAGVRSTDPVGRSHKQITTGEDAIIMTSSTVRPVHFELEALDIPVEDETRAYRARYVLASTRIALGWVFLWAFLDKTFGLGFATERADAWINGGSPTFGFLNFGTEGKIFHDFFASLSGPAADWVFMIGLLGIGLALILGIGMRVAAISGSIMLVLMWTAELRLENNPFMDDHIVYALVLTALAIYGAGRTWGLGKVWEQLSVVRRFPILK
jgi:thiosulfate dehydrogenase [quinone] large subunit